MTDTMRELYALRSQHFLGAKIDLDETYEWGIEELGRMVAEQTRIAGEIVPGGSVADAIAALEKEGVVFCGKQKGSAGNAAGRS